MTVGIRKSIHRFLQLSWDERWLLLESGVSVSLASAVVRMLPFGWYRSQLGEQGRAEASTLSPTQREVALQISRNIRRVKARVPWMCTCMMEAIAGQSMLHRRHIDSVLCIGVRRDEEKLHFHASLRCHDLWVTGGPMEESFSVLLTFSKASKP
ncbi:MAG: lasso peptide biosynthesis B2 protein [Deltaproteobacteria bacterium]|nr:MAG: lasso peptide biosynthesis B2 protein [Deltaproteobacteria bacterium]